MKAVFEVRTIEADWAPPFRRGVKTEEFTASKSEDFDRITGNGNDEPVFQLLEIGNERAKVKFSRLFTIKSSVDQEKNKEMWLSKGHEQTITYLWGERGITKKIVYKGIAPPRQTNGESYLRNGEMAGKSTSQEAAEQEQEPMREVAETTVHGSQPREDSNQKYPYA